MVRNALYILLFFISLSCGATPIKDLYKTVVQITTFDAEGKQLQQAAGVFVSSTGDVLGAYTTLQDAQRAEVVDFRGQKYEVHRILAANRNQDLVRFSVSGVKKSVEYTEIADAGLEANAQVLLRSYTTNKKESATPTLVVKVEPFEDFSYYTLTLPNDDQYFTLPLFTNDEKEAKLIGFVQRNAVKDATTACAIDARFGLRLTLAQRTLLNADVRSLSIPAALPATEEEAFTFLNLPFPNEGMRLTAIQDFIAAYPRNTEGFLQHASLLTAKKQYAEAEKEVRQALHIATEGGDSLSTSVDGVHYQWSKLLMQAAVSDSLNAAEAGWTLARAEEETSQAYELQANPLYLIQQGDIYVAQRRYAEAATTYLAATADSAFATPQVLHTAAQCLKLSGAETLAVLDVLDRAIAKLPTPSPARYAYFYTERAALRSEMKLYREATEDYNKYEQIIGPKNLTDRFYYLRYETNMLSRRYQQALNDIQSARIAAPQNPDYELEEAALYVQVGEYDQALPLLTSLATRYPESAEVFRFLALCYGEKGQKSKALETLRRAEALGAEIESQLWERYK